MKVIDHYTCNEHQKVMVNIEIDNEKYTLISVYAPNQETEGYIFIQIWKYGLKIIH